MDTVHTLREQVQVRQKLAEFKPGQVLELEGYRVRVLKVSPPDEFRNYGLIYLESLDKLVPAVVWAKVDEYGFHFEPPQGWKS